MDFDRFLTSEIIDAAREVIPPYEAEDMEAFLAAAWGDDGDDGEGGEDPPPAAPAALPVPRSGGGGRILQMRRLPRGASEPLRAAA